MYLLRAVEFVEGVSHSLHRLLALAVLVDEIADKEENGKSGATELSNGVDGIGIRHSYNDSRPAFAYFRPLWLSTPIMSIIISFFALYLLFKVATALDRATNDADLSE